MRFDIFVGDENALEEVCISFFDVSEGDARIIARVLRDHCSRAHDVVFRPLYSDGGEE